MTGLKDYATLISEIDEKLSLIGSNKLKSTAKYIEYDSAGNLVRAMGQCKAKDFRRD